MSESPAIVIRLLVVTKRLIRFLYGLLYLISNGFRSLVGFGHSLCRLVNHLVCQYFSFLADFLGEHLGVLRCGFGSLGGFFYRLLGFHHTLGTLVDSLLGEYLGIINRIRLILISATRCQCRNYDPWCQLPHCLPFVFLNCPQESCINHADLGTVNRVNFRGTAFKAM
ncbi:MAG: hypothetical protein R3200_03805 [Xanthomonadales bacterium]|nr:hypothetical protein [Xanthomonadales bacterium]